MSKCLLSSLLVPWCSALIMRVVSVLCGEYQMYILVDQGCQHLSKLKLHQEPLYLLILVQALTIGCFHSFFFPLGSSARTPCADLFAWG